MVTTTGTADATRPVSIEHRVQLRALVDAYSLGLDRQRFHGVAEMFTPGGVLVVPETPGWSAQDAECVGRASVETAFGGLANFLGTIHEIVAHSLCWNDGVLRGEMSCIAQHIDRDERGRLRNTVLARDYADTYVSPNGTWQFERRALTVLWTEHRAVSAARDRTGRWVG